MLNTLAPNDTMTAEREGTEVRHGANITWIDPGKYGFIRDLFEGTEAVLQVANPESVMISVDSAPATLDTPIGTARQVEVRPRLGRKG